MSEGKKIKPSLSKGTRDFLPSEVAKRNYIFDTIKSVFRKYGFEQIETPAIERLETLTGKYGEEGDKLLFKILNSGNPFLKLLPQDLELIQQSIWRHFDIPPMLPVFPFENIKGSDFPIDVSAIVKKVTEKGLRYDLTVPLARYVVQHQEDLAFPFKRFHIGPVWRADRPQKGRYQEFYQCDADVIGSTSLLNEVELLKIYLESFSELGFNDGNADKIVVVKVNNRKILSGILEYLGVQNRSKEFTTVIDKYDKIGHTAILKELRDIGLSELQINEFNQIISANRQDTGLAFYDYFKTLFAQREIKIGLEGIDEMKFIKSHFDSGGLNTLRFDVLLARGLDYYTGLITEVSLDMSSIGSLGGGGRYDNLTEMFGAQNMSGVGKTFGNQRN
jgi:histidyl-tRNA synthetase